MLRPRLRVALVLPLLALSTGCAKTAPTPECPPCAETEAGPENPTKTDARSPAADATPLRIELDDGHSLHAWVLEPPADQAPGLEPDQAQPARAIVLVHGRTWSSAPDFDLRIGDDPRASLAHRLTLAGYTVYGVDMRGYGGSERDPSGWLEPERAADDLGATLAQVRDLEGAPPDLLGWSYGAIIAQLAVQRHPDAARSLVLYGYPRDPRARTPERPATLDEPAPAKATTEPAVRSDFLVPGTDEALIAAFVEHCLRADPVRTDWRAIHEFNALDPAAIPVPTLLIHGAHDPIAKPAWQAALFSGLRVEDRQWVVIPKADHAAHFEQPEAFDRALLGFLAPND